MRLSEGVCALRISTLLSSFSFCPDFLVYVCSNTRNASEWLRLLEGKRGIAVLVLFPLQGPVRALTAAVRFF